MAVQGKSRPPVRRLDRRTRRARAEGRGAREALLAAALDVFAERGFKDASIDQIAERAGYSKGAVYWHFEGKADLFFALLDERLDRPLREALEQLASAPPDQDMSLEANRFLSELVRERRQLLMIDHEYWSQAIRDPKLRARYAKRQNELRSAFARALETRLQHLGAPPIDTPAEQMATILMGVGAGLAQEKLVNPGAVPDDLLGKTFAVIYAGFVARALAARDGQN